MLPKFRSPFAQLLCRAMAFIAVVVVVRFALELLGVPPHFARYFSSTAAVFLTAIYVAAVGPLRGGLRTVTQHLLPALILAAWTEAWIIIATVISALLHLTRSHFAKQKDFGDPGHLRFHLLQHTVAISVLFVTLLLVMTIIHILWRWPVTVGPGAMLGVFVVMRFWTEARGLAPLRTAAWSSTVLVLLSGIYLGGIGPRVGLTSPQLLAPSLVLAAVWRAWVYLATVFAAFVTFFQTHFFDASRGHIASRLLLLLPGFAVEAFIVGFIVWGIAVWMGCATRPQPAVRPESK